MLNTSRSRWMALILIVGIVGYLVLSRSYPIVNAPPRQGPIVAFGDSLTAGFGASPGETYPDQLAKMIGRPVINAGVNGNTIADASQRLPRDVMTHKPAIVIVLLGGNDVLRRQDLDQSFAELERIVRRIQGGGAMVVLVGIQAITPIGGVTGRYASLARRTGCVYVPNILHEIFFDHSLMFDQIHPNGKGYAIVAERIAKALQPFL